MRRRWRGLLTFISRAVFVLISAALLRSYFVHDYVTWGNTTEEPLTAEARAYAQQRGFTPNFISRTVSHTVGVVRGRVYLSRALWMNVMSRWEDEFYRQHVNRPQWRYDRKPATEWKQGGGFWWTLGFHAEEFKVRGPWQSQFRTHAAPLWPIVLASAVAPAMWLRRRLRERRRRRSGLCLKCGYDLRGISGGGRCPECGTAADGDTIQPQHKEPAHVD